MSVCECGVVSVDVGLRMWGGLLLAIIHSFFHSLTHACITVATQSLPEFWREPVSELFLSTHLFFFKRPIQSPMFPLHIYVYKTLDI